MLPQVITGSSGFIGKHLYRQIRADGLIIGLDRATGSDITEPFLLPRQLGNIYHLAAISSIQTCEEQPIKAISTNINGTSKMLMATQEATGFILASSAAVYGNHKGPCVETDKLSPIGTYGLSKQAGEILTAISNRTALRLFNVYGTGSKSAISQFINKALNDEPLYIRGIGEQTRDFIHVDDVCNAFIAAGNKPGIYNIGTGKETTINEVANLILDICGSSSKIIYTPKNKEDIKYSCADISKARKELNFKAKIKLKKGIKELAEKIQNESKIRRWEAEDKTAIEKGNGNTEIPPGGIRNEPSR